MLSFSQDEWGCDLKFTYYPPFRLTGYEQPSHEICIIFQATAFDFLSQNSKVVSKNVPVRFYL